MNQPYQRPRKPLSRAQIAELKRKRRRQRWDLSRVCVAAIDCSDYGSSIGCA